MGQPLIKFSQANYTKYITRFYGEPGMPKIEDTSTPSNFGILWVAPEYKIPDDPNAPDPNRGGLEEMSSVGNFLKIDNNTLHYVAAIQENPADADELRKMLNWWGFNAKAGRPYMDKLDDTGTIPWEDTDWVGWGPLVFSGGNTVFVDQEKFSNNDMWCRLVMFRRFQMQMGFSLPEGLVHIGSGIRPGDITFYPYDKRLRSPLFDPRDWPSSQPADAPQFEHFWIRKIYLRKA